MHEFEQVVGNEFYVASVDRIMFYKPTKETYEVSQDSMQPYCYVHTAALDMVIDAHRGETSGNCTESADLFFTDPQYYTRRETNSDNSDHYHRNPEDINKESDAFDA